MLSGRGPCEELITRPEDVSLPRNLVNEEAMANWGILHKKNKDFYILI